MKSYFQHLINESKHTVSLMMIAISVVIFFITSFTGLFDPFFLRDIYMVFGLSSKGVFEKFWIHQLITSNFIHANGYHIFFNMLVLWMLGPPVEKKLGAKRFLLMLITSLICGGGAFLLVNQHQDVVSIGMSDVIYGILIAAAVFFPDNLILIFGFFPMKLKYGAILMSIVEFYLSVVSPGSGISHISHFGGGLGAYIFLKAPQITKILLHKSKKNPPANESTIKPDFLVTVFVPESDETDTREKLVIDKAVRYGLNALSAEDKQIYMARMNRLGRKKGR